MPKRHTRQPFDAHMDVGCGSGATGNVGQVAASRRTRSHKDGVVIFFQQLAHAVYTMVEMGVDAKAQNITNLLIQNGLRKPESRDLAAHHAAAFGVFVVQVDGIPQRRQVARNGKRCRSATHQSNGFAVGGKRTFGHVRNNFAFVVGSHTFQAANGNGFIFHTSAAAGRFARPVARSAQNTGKNVGFPVHQISFRVPLGGNQTDVFGHGRMGRTCVLAVDYFVEIFRIFDVGRFHGAADL